MPSRVLLVIGWSICFSAVAQPDSTASRPRYFFSLHAGGLFGKSDFGTAFTSSFIQGARYRRLAVGAGIGYDAYSEWRTMPVFASVNYDFLRYRDNAFFVQVNAGTAVIRNPLLPENQFTDYEDNNLSLNPLLGYRITGDKFNLYLSAGFKFQRIRYGWSWGSNGGKTRVEREIERIAIQLGFGFR